MTTLIDEHINRNYLTKKYSFIDIKVTGGMIEDTPSRLSQSDLILTFFVEKKRSCLTTNSFNATKKDK